MVKIALIGAGQRGYYVYSEYISRHAKEAKLVAVAEPNAVRREAAALRHGISPSMQFADWRELLEQDKLADAVIIATNDDMHYKVIEKALEKGYHILVEKPMTNKESEIIAMEQLAVKYPDRIFAVAHVLRYTPFFRTIKQLLDEGGIGELISIQHNENIGYYHMAHSFVRGNWRDSSVTSPLILAKSCHDMDILLYLAGSHYKKIASFGSLKHFCRDKMPEDAKERCVECKWQNSCPYSALTIYMRDPKEWPANIITEEHTKEGVQKALEETDYGRCVYRHDNNVVDHQVTIMEFTNGVTATFNLSGFTHSISRTIKLMGSKGEIRGDMERNQVEVYHFGKEEPEMIRTVPGQEGHVGHGGGDEGLMDEFIAALEDVMDGKTAKEMKTSVLISTESHRAAFAAERARVEGNVIFL